jgi:hypothetical protein
MASYKVVLKEMDGSSHRQFSVQASDIELEGCTCPTDEEADACRTQHF